MQGVFASNPLNKHELDSIRNLTINKQKFTIEQIEILLKQDWNRDYAYNADILKYFEKLILKTGDKCKLGLVKYKIGVMEHSSIEVAVAITAYNEALTIFNACNDTVEILRTLSSIGRYYNVHNKPNFTYSYYKTAYHLAKDYNKSHIIINSALDLAKYYGENNHADSSIIICKALLKSNNYTNDSNNLGLIYLHLGWAYQGLKDTTEALKHYEMSLRYFKNKSLRFEALCERGIAMLIKYKKPKEALHRLQIARKYQPNSAIRKQIYADLSLAFKANKIFDSAYYYLVLFNQTNDSIINQSHLNTIEELRIKYDREMKVEQIEKLQQLNKNQKKVRLLLILLLGLFVILLVVTAYYFKKVVAKNKIIEDSLSKKAEKQKQLEVEIENKEILLKEVHHRVKNNLQMISSMFSIQQNLSENSSVNEVLVTGQKRIQSMAYIHNILYELKDLNILNLNTLLVTTIKNFIKLYSTPQKELSITYRGEDTNIDADIFVHIGMLINELITNSCKHNIVSGTSINVNIQLKKTGLNSLQITYADNSGGYNLQKFENPNTMGLLIIKNIVQNQLKGEINVENTFGGCTYTIIFNY